MLFSFTSKSILDQQTAEILLWKNNLNAQKFSGTSFLSLVSRQHQTNYNLWHEEDKARDPKASDQFEDALENRFQT